MFENLKKIDLKEPREKNLLPAKETLFKHWHMVLLVYALCNVIFIVISIFVLSDISVFNLGSSNNDIEHERVFDPNNLEPVVQLQRYKNLVKEGEILIDSEVSI